MRNRRRRSLRVKRRSVIGQARKIRQMPLVVDPMVVNNIKLSASLYYKGFIPRNNFSHRQATNRKQAHVESLLPEIFKFHCSLMKDFQREPHVDLKFGHYGKRDIFNFDQVPLPFVCDDNRTVNEKGATRVWCRQPGSGLEKRQSTLHLTMCADDEALQPKPIIIFRGKGTNILKSEESKKWVSQNDRVESNTSAMLTNHTGFTRRGFVSTECLD